ncbi:MAG: hypothetical protein WCV71_04730 [Patescibacteria group bacterium]
MKLKKQRLLTFLFLLFLPLISLAAEPIGQAGLQQAAQAAGFGMETNVYVITVRWINGFLSVFTMVATFLLVNAGFSWMTSGGNAEKVLSAKNTIKNTLLGLVIALTAYSLTRYVLMAMAQTTGAV